MDLLHKVVSYLDDPYLVASFQTYCGLTLNTDNTQPPSEDAIYGVTGLNNPSIVFRDEDDPRMTCYNDQNGEITQSEDETGHHGHTNISSDTKLTTATRTDTTHVQKRNLSSTVINEEEASSPVSKASYPNGDIPAKSTTKTTMPPAQCRLPYKINNKLFYYLFSFGAALGNELFYTTFFPFVLWNVDAFICRTVVVTWWITLYAGQATKDILKRPRPISPPVIKLEARYELEYGMPSTHAMVGTCIPFTMLFIASQRYQFPFMVGFFLALLWLVLVSLSRIYLGMHSVLDVIVGILYVCILIPLLFPFLHDFDQFSVTHPLAPIFTIGIPFVMCVCYPPVDKWNTARRDTTLLVAVAAGISVGSWLSYQYGLAAESPPPPYQISLPTLTSIILSFIRILIGVPLMLLTGELLRPIVRRITSYLLQMDLRDPKIKRMQVYELTDSFIPFLFVAINVTFTIPLIFKFLSIDRPEYYSELLIPANE